MQFINAPIARKAIENPVPSGVYRLPKYTQIIQPYEFGHPYSKKTCLWLVNLPALTPTKIVKPVCGWVSGGSKRADGTPRKNKGMPFRDSTRRSKTFAGIAKAMAEQWGGSETKIETAIEQLKLMIKQCECYEDAVLEDDNEDAQEELHDVEVELEALRMAVRALENQQGLCAEVQRVWIYADV